MAAGDCYHRTAGDNLRHRVLDDRLLNDGPAAFLTILCLDLISDSPLARGTGLADDVSTQTQAAVRHDLDRRWDSLFNGLDLGARAQHKHLDTRANRGIRLRLDAVAGGQFNLLFF